jgi:hypothetical protein
MKWNEYEKVVRDIQERMGEGLDIEHDVSIQDSGGIERQFDVVCKGKLQNVDVLYVTECKHRSRPVDMDQVEAFNQKAISVNANIKAIYSKKGFRKNALILAKRYGINCYSICEDGITVNNKKKFGWHNFAKNIVVSLVGGEYQLTNKDDYDNSAPLKISGIDLIWFLRACVENGVQNISKANKPEEIFCELYYLISIKPKKGSNYFLVSVGEKKKRCKWLKAKVRISPVVKMKFTPLCGLGVYDHHKEEVSLPKGESIHGAVIDTRNFGKIFEEWDDATMEMLKNEKVLVFWMQVPPIPKAFDKRRYSIYTRKIDRI